jgi:hypothetical protein
MRAGERCRCTTRSSVGSAEPNRDATPRTWRTNSRGPSARRCISSWRSRVRQNLRRSQVLTSCRDVEKRNSFSRNFAVLRTIPREPMPFPVTRLQRYFRSPGSATPTSSSLGTRECERVGSLAASPTPLRTRRSALSTSSTRRSRLLDNRAARCSGAPSAWACVPLSVCLCVWLDLIAVGNPARVR